MVTLPCDCGEPCEVAYEHALKVRAGAMPPPKCRGCRWPTVERRAEEEAVEWVERLPEETREAALSAVAVLR